MSAKQIAAVLVATVIPLAVALAGQSAAPRSEVHVVMDEVTHVPMRFLTTGPAGNAKIYQTHPQWTADGSHIIFRSSNRSSEGPAIFALRESDGAITQLTHGKGVKLSSINVSRLANHLFYFREGGDKRLRLIRLDFPASPEAGAAPKETTITTFPEGFRDAGGFAIDMDESAAYTGVLLDDAPSPQEAAKRHVEGEIWAIDLKTGAIRTVVKTPFRVGHVEANPWLAGELMYCNETGGDAPQRMWIVKADGTGSRPLFVEGPTDWVTHETFVDRDHVMFNIMGHTPELRKRPTGVAVIDLRTDVVEMVGQLPTGRGFWHSNGTTDGHLAVADDFDGEVYLMDRKTGERILLSTGHMMKPDHTHPNFSPDGTRILIQSGRESGGKRLDLVTLPVPKRFLVSK
ncbi:oligogalacturonide lyase [Rhizomicrobium palustre]|uniref:Oligogalacturonide lyase n=1 Tax=Rhizomicrobium palustre TaxID=189966 RepID=A0A846MZP1_9PROT|nr:PD40 domain-containing protein [Rhizomicrobium palustre]NIK89134.1 oligogalacturonide lyase [Rhizomicrobium palustre]